MVAAIAAMTVAFAGPAVEVELAPVTKDFYIGGGIAAYNNYIDGEKDFFDDTIDSEISGGLEIKAGYVFYRATDVKVSVEAQAGSSVWSFINDSVDSPSTYNFAAFIKPEYLITDEASVYALVGYGRSVVDFDNGFKVSENGFAYGAGAEYAVTEDVAVYAEYVMLPAFDTEVVGDDVNNDKATIGVSYKF